MGGTSVAPGAPTAGSRATHSGGTRGAGLGRRRRRATGDVVAWRRERPAVEAGRRAAAPVIVMVAPVIPMPAIVSVGLPDGSLKDCPTAVSCVSRYVCVP